MQIKYLLIGLILPIALQAQDLSQEQIQQDFESLKKALSEGHPGLYWYSSKEELAETYLQVEAALAEVNNVAQMQSLFTDINNTIACGHTAILLPEAHYKVIDSLNLFLPFNIALVEGKVLISESFTGSLSRGDELLSINGEAIDKVIEQLVRFVPIDKEIATKRTRSIELIFSYYYAVYKDNPAKFALEYKKQAKGKRLRKEVEAIGINEKMYKSVRDFAPSQFPLELSFNDTKQAVVLKLSTFGGQSFKEHEINFHDTIKGIFDYIDKNHIENLVLDLRWNNGGNMRFAEYLFSFFIDSTYLYYLDAEIKQSVMEGTTKYGRSRNMLPMMAKQFGVLKPKDGIYYLSGEKSPVEPTAPLFNGQLYLITNGFSFSATSAFIAHIQENNIGQIVGETPGGAFDGVNAGPPMMVELPNSKIRLYYRIIGSRYNVDARKVRANVDFEVDNTLKGFTQGKDEQLESVLELIKD
jgi:C-terminal processing protease CtpA/Prc